MEDNINIIANDDTTNNTTDILKVSPLNNNLTQTERKQAEFLSKKIDINNDNSIMNFGIETQKKLGDSSTKILAHVKTKDAEEAGNALAELVAEVRGYDIDQNFFEKTMSKLPLVGHIFDQTRKIISKHQNVESNLDEIVTRLEKSNIALVKDNQNIRFLYDENVKFITENKVNIEAIEIKIKETKEVLIPEMEKKCIENPHDDIQIQKLSKLKNTLNRMEKKSFSMKLFNTSAIQSLPRLTLIENGNNELVQNIHDTVLNVIPLWRNQIAEALALNRQKKVADLNEAVYNMTNDLIKNNALRSKENTIAIAKQMERGIIDIETLEKSNKVFIETLDSVIKIKEDGAKNRIEAEKKMEEIKKELSDKIKSIQVSSTPDKSSTLDVNYEEVEDYTKLTN